MNSLKCTHCRLVYIVRGDDPSCPRCGAANEPEPEPPAEGRGSLGALAALACALLLAAGGAVYYLRPGPTPAYVEAIRASEQFRRLATVRVNQEPLGRPGAASLKVSGDTFGREEGVTFAAYVLGERGLLSIGHETTVSRMPPMQQYQLRMRTGPGGVTYEESVPYTVREGYESKHRYLTVSLTPAGEREAEGWDETEEFYAGHPKVPFWRVPVGEAEFVRLGQVLDGPGADGERRLTVEVVWRWRPNLLGQTFDKGGAVIGLLPEKARAAAARLGLSSDAELRAVAELEPTAGGGWRVLSVEPANALAGDFMTVD